MKTCKNTEGYQSVFEKRYCSLCEKYNERTKYCPVLKNKIKLPYTGNCSWFKRIHNEKIY